MTNIKTPIFAAVSLLVFGGALAWTINDGKQDTNVNTGIESASPDTKHYDSAKSSTTHTQPIKTTEKTTVTSTTVTSTIVTSTTVKQPTSSTVEPNTTTTSTVKPNTTTTSTVKQPEKNKPTETTVRKPDVADPDLIIDNGYYNIDGVRVVGNELANKTVQKCGEINGYNPKGLGSGRVKAWYQYANGRISNKEIVMRGQNAYLAHDSWGQLAHRSVFIMSDGIGYGEAGYDDETEEFIKTNWIYCRNNPAITPEDFLP